MQRLASAGLHLQHERGGAYWQTKALQTSRLSPNSHLFPSRATTAKRRPTVLSTVRKVWMVRSTGAGARKPFEGIVRRRRDILRPIPYRTRGTVAPPASGHSCRPTSLWWPTRRSAIKSSLPVDWLACSSSFSRSLQQRWPLISGSARCARDATIDEHAIHARPSYCGFWNLVIAHAWKFPQAYGAFLGMLTRSLDFWAHNLLVVDLNVVNSQVPSVSAHFNSHLSYWLLYQSRPASNDTHARSAHPSHHFRHRPFQTRDIVLQKQFANLCVYVYESQTERVHLVSLWFCQRVKIRKKS